MPKVLIVPWIINKIRQAIGIVQDTDTATQAISKDSYVMWRGSLKKAKSAISQNDTLSSTNLDDVPGGFGSVVKNLDDKIGATTMGTTDTTITGAVKEVRETIKETAFPVANGTTISSATDFNTLLTTGIYTFQQNSLVSTCSNKPCDIAGKLCVWSINNSNLASAWGSGGQIYKTYEGQEYYRQINSDGSGNTTIGKWWSSFDDTYALRWCRSIPNSTNFDTIIKPGNYRVLSYSNANTMTNMPIVMAGTLVVRNAMLEDDGNYLIQTYETHQGKEYKRFTSDKGSTWSAWTSLTDQVATKSEIVVIDGFSNGTTKTYTLPTAHVYLIIGSHPYSEAYFAIFASWSGGAQRLTALKTSAQLNVSVDSSSNKITVSATGNMWLRILDLGYMAA